MENNYYNEDMDTKIEKERKNYQGEHCCMTMDYELRSDFTIVLYSAKFREYGIQIPKSSTFMLMDYCMFCGKKMPQSLREEWFDILEKEYGLERPISGDRKKVPAEFLTDEWWKKRGL